MANPSPAPDSARRQLRNGREFVLEAPTTTPALWGVGREVVWAEGEPLLVCGPQGVGKTSVVQQVASKRAGIGPAEFLGFPVKRAAGKVLYVAADRPSQIARSWRRMVTEEDADTLTDRLLAWRGPLPFNLTQQPEALAEWVLEIGGVSDLFVDSLKDVVPNLSSEDGGGAWNRAAAGVVAAGINLAATHHQRKATGENKKPTSLSDVYGSTWITSGAGSVLLLWGEPGDPLVELSHLKQPAEEVGPLDLEHDHEHGRTTRRERVDEWALLQGATTTGIAVRDVAGALHGTATPAQVEKVRRRLDKFVDAGHALLIPPSKQGDPGLYRPTGRNGAVTPRDPQREGSRSPSQNHHDSHEPPETLTRRPSRSTHESGGLTSPLKEWGEREPPDGTSEHPADDHLAALIERNLDLATPEDGEVTIALPTGDDDEEFAAAILEAFPGSSVMA
jgi:hypothetical protein